MGPEHMTKFTFTHIGEDHNLSLDETTAVLIKIAERIREDCQEAFAYTYNKRDKLARLKLRREIIGNYLDLIEAYINQLPEESE